MKLAGYNLETLHTGITPSLVSLHLPTGDCTHIETFSPGVVLPAIPHLPPLHLLLHQLRAVRNSSWRLRSQTPTALTSTTSSPKRLHATPRSVVSISPPISCSPANVYCVQCPRNTTRPMRPPRKCATSTPPTPHALPSPTLHALVDGENPVDGSEDDERSEWAQEGSSACRSW